MRYNIIKMKFLILIILFVCILFINNSEAGQLEGEADRVRMVGNRDERMRASMPKSKRKEKRQVKRKPITIPDQDFFLNMKHEL